MNKDIFTRGKAVEELRKRYNEIVDNAKNYRDMTIQTLLKFTYFLLIHSLITLPLIPVSLAILCIEKKSFSLFTDILPQLFLKRICYFLILFNYICIILHIYFICITIRFIPSPFSNKLRFQAFYTNQIVSKPMS